MGSASAFWKRSPRALLAIEVGAVLVWLVLAGMLIVQQSQETGLVPLDVESLKTGPSRERWAGIFFQDQHVGYSVSRASGVVGGGQVHEERSLFRVATFGRLTEVVTAGSALISAEGYLSQFDFFMAADPVRLSVRGEVRNNAIVMEVAQAGEVSTLEFPVSEAPHVGMSLESRIRQEGELAVGKRFAFPYFDPVSLAEGTMEVEVVDVEVLENAEEAYWLKNTFGELETRSLVLSNGEMVRQEGAMGLSIVRMKRDEATDLPDDAGDVDLIAMSAVPLTGKLPKDARRLRILAVNVEGVDASKVDHQPPLQVVQDKLVRVEMPLYEEVPRLPVQDYDEPQWVAPTMTLPANHDEIVAKATEVVGDAADRKEATKRLVDFVYGYLEKTPTLSVPNGLEVLRTGQGDCNEHTALFVSLARAAGIPSRIAAGVVYSDRVGDGAFYYHAWPEVRLGGPTEWVPVDPTFGQFPADATHIKLVEGDLERQIEIMGVIGKLRFELVEAL